MDGIKNNETIQKLISTALKRQKVEIAILQKAQEAGEIGGHITPHLLSVSASIQFLGLLTLWVSMDGAFDWKAGVHTPQLTAVKFSR
ncbi:hypothetical protein FACS1894147_09370 [Spirochaetia bacterium]|nr:hypothetical protein FACS1894147_09370 [Spirochaetia bacterium]